MYQYNRYILKCTPHKVVEYTDDLVRDGVILNVKTKLDPEEKKEFRSFMDGERDVVRINFN